MAALQNGHSTRQDQELGVIVRLDRHGLAILETKENGRAYPFTFDKIRSYRGQSPREMGLRRGAQVKFVADDGKIKDVEILPAAV